MLAEAIVCGRPGSDQTAELITGVKPVSQGEWHEDLGSLVTAANNYKMT